MRWFCSYAWQNLCRIRGCARTPLEAEDLDAADLEAEDFKAEDLEAENYKGEDLKAVAFEASEVIPLHGARALHGGGDREVYLRGGCGGGGLCGGDGEVGCECLREVDGVGEGGHHVLSEERRPRLRDELGLHLREGERYDVAGLVIGWLM